MQRYIEQTIINDLKKKMVFVGGPRQVGKTTMAKNLAPKSHQYINWDVYQDQQLIIHQIIPDSKFIIFDEIHKYPMWRNYLKGIFDKYNAKKTILVTGSAKLDYYRYSGDSLQGRYYYYRLHPLSVKELGINTQADMVDLMTLGGFPEPYFSGSKVEAKRWSRDYQKRFIYEEVNSLEQTKNLTQMQLLIERLPDLVASPLSVNALREDLQVAHKTVDKWLDIFERMHSIFRVSAFGAPNIKAVKKERKHYFFNWSLITDEGACFENLIACHLLKWCHYQQDVYGEDMELKYFRDKTGREVDFIICHDKKPIEAIEVKLTNRDVSKHLIYFKNKFPEIKASQVALKNKNHYITKEDIHMISWKELLHELI